MILPRQGVPAQLRVRGLRLHAPSATAVPSPASGTGQLITLGAKEDVRSSAGLVGVVENSQTHSPFRKQLAGSLSACFKSASVGLFYFSIDFCPSFDSPSCWQVACLLVLNLYAKSFHSPLKRKPSTTPQQLCASLKDSFSLSSLYIFTQR